MRGFKNFKGSDARCPSIHFLFYGIGTRSLVPFEYVTTSGMRILLKNHIFYTENKSIVSVYHSTCHYSNNQVITTKNSKFQRLLF